MGPTDLFFLRKLSFCWFPVSIFFFSGSGAPPFRVTAKNRLTLSFPTAPVSKARELGASEPRKLPISLCFPPYLYVSSPLLSFEPVSTRRCIFQPRVFGHNALFPSEQCDPSTPAISWSKAHQGVCIRGFGIRFLLVPCCSFCTFPPSSPRVLFSACPASGASICSPLLGVVPYAFYWWAKIQMSKEPSEIRTIANPVQMM